MKQIRLYSFLLMFAFGITAITSCTSEPVSYTHLRAHETVLDIVCRLLLEKTNTQTTHTQSQQIYNNKQNS